MKNSSYRNLLLVSVLIFICLFPILRSGLYSDDLPNFETRASIKHIGAFDFVARSEGAIEAWKNGGRYNPAALSLQNFVFDQFKSVVAYKVYVLFCNLLAVASFGLLLYALGLSFPFITLSLFFFLAEIQFRIQNHDAFTSLNGLYPLFTATIFFSLAFLSFYLNGGKRYWYLLSLLFAVVALLFLEIGIILIPLFLVVIFFSKNALKRKVMAAAPLLTICFIYLAYVLYLRGTHSSRYTGIQSNFNPDDMLRVLNVQLFSALPFSNLYRQKAIPEILISQITNPSNLVSVILIITGSTYLVYTIVKSKWSSSRDKHLLPLFIAIILFFVPAIVLMPSVKYQTELWLGAGYLPVYIQNFGVALFLAVVVNYCLTISAGVLIRGIFTGIACANIVAAVFALLFNSALIDVMNYNRSYPAEAQRGAIERGIMSSVSNNSNIALASDYFWQDAHDYDIIMNNVTGKDFNVFDADKLPLSEAGSAKNPCFLLECNKGDTIYTRLYEMNCATGVKDRLVAVDTVFHKIRLSEVEEPILVPRL